ncbi:MAG: phosphomannomutase/phosphoglucomutase, partial [Patescibacteria group bacterium]
VGTAMMVLELISNDGRKFSEIVNEFEKYPASGEMNFMVPDIQSIMDKLQASHTDAVSVDTLDGLSVWYADWWFNVRASHTEPLLRLNVEANTKELLEEKTAILVEKIKKDSLY